MTIEEFIRKGYITNNVVANGLLKGTLTIEQAKPYITSPAVHKLLNSILVASPVAPTTKPAAEATVEPAVKRVVEETVSCIRFYIDETEYIYTGKPATSINKGLKSMNISTPIYHNGEVVSGQMSGLSGLHLTSTKSVKDEPVVETPTEPVVESTIAAE